MRRWKAEDRCLYDIWRYHDILNRTMYGVAREAEATPLMRETIEEYSCIVFSMRSIGPPRLKSKSCKPVSTSNSRAEVPAYVDESLAKSVLQARHVMD